MRSSSSTYSHGRLQRALGSIVGKQLGITTNTGGIKPLPDTNTYNVRVKRVYPQKRMVEFSFMDSEEIYTAHALIDHWHREGQDKNTNNIELPLIEDVKEFTWPFTSPESPSPDLITLLRLLVVMGVSGAAPMLALMEQLTRTLEGKREVLELIQNQKFTLQTLLKLLNINIPGLETLTNIEQLTNISNLLETLKIDTKKLEDILDTKQLQDLKTFLTKLELDIGELEDLSSDERLEKAKTLLNSFEVDTEILEKIEDIQEIEDIKTLLTELDVDTGELEELVDIGQLEEIKNLLTSLGTDTKELTDLISIRRLEELKTILTNLGVDIEGLVQLTDSEYLEKLKMLLTLLEIDLNEISNIIKKNEGVDDTNGKQ